MSAFGRPPRLNFLLTVALSDWRRGGGAEMSLSGPDWVKLSRLLDQVLDLEPAQRSQWMDSLAPEYESLRETLRDLLFRKAGLETSDVLRRAPSLVAAQISTLAAGDLVGAYRLIRQIGAGGMATVWLAERADGSLQRQVALKLPRISLIDRDLADRLNRERDILASLEHPGIARLYDAGTDDAGRPYLAIEYVDGIPLDLYVASTSLTIPQRLALFLQVARAVAYAHAHMVVHRDLKPTNVLVRDDGEVRLLDFGIAQLLQPDSLADAQHAQNSARAFTPCYAAPEQFEGQPATVATDVYSLGVVLYELLGRRSPYPQGRKMAGRVEQGMVCFDIIPVLSVVDPRTARVLRGDLEAILSKALQQRPSDRYETVSAFIEDIQRHQRNLPVLAQPDSVKYRAGKFVRRHRTAVILGIALLSAVIVGAAASLWQANAALHERGRALRLFEQAEATNEFWSMLFTEGVGNEESITMSELLTRSEEMAEKTFVNAPLQYSVAIDAIAALYISYGLHSKAESLLEKALQRTGKLDQGIHRTASLQCKYAMAIGSLGRPQEADDILRRVIEQAGDEPDLQQYCLHRRSIIARDSDDAAGSLKYVQEARRISITSPVQSQIKSAQLLGDLAYAHALNGESDLAQRYYDESWTLFTTLGRDESHVALTVLNNWGILAVSTGNPAAALGRYERAIAFAQKRSPEGEAPPYLLGNRAGALASLARFDDALRDYDQLIVHAARNKSARFMTYAVAGAADVYLKRGDPGKAQEMLNSLYAEIGKEFQDRGPAALRLMVVQGRIWTQQGRLTEAHGILGKAIQELESNTAKAGGLALPYIARAEELLASLRPDEALQDSKRAIEIATAARGQNPYSNVLGLASLVHGEVQLQRGDRASAAQSLRTAVANLKNTVGDDHPDTRRAEAMLREQA